MTDAKPKRRWFRFSLRTLFLAITVFCLWFAWRANVVRERADLINSIDSRLGLGVQRDGRPTTAYRVIQKDESRRLPLVWTLLGIKPVHFLAIPCGVFTPQEIQRIKKAFPELDDSQFSVLEL